jgi:hypothetical protein
MFSHGPESTGKRRHTSHMHTYMHAYHAGSQYIGENSLHIHAYIRTYIHAGFRHIRKINHGPKSKGFVSHMHTYIHTYMHAYMQVFDILGKIAMGPSESARDIAIELIGEMCGDEKVCMYVFTCVDIYIHKYT